MEKEKEWAEKIEQQTSEYEAKLVANEESSKALEERITQLENQLQSQEAKLNQEVGYTDMVVEVVVVVVVVGPPKGLMSIAVDGTAGG